MLLIVDLPPREQRPDAGQEEQDQPTGVSHLLKNGAATVSRSP
jgi:hypothetical protein